VILTPTQRWLIKWWMWLTVVAYVVVGLLFVLAKLGWL
jgi:hypothetical protein